MSTTIKKEPKKLPTAPNTAIVPSTRISKFFVDLKFNKKRPKYNYHSGLLAGMIVNELVYLEPIIKNKNETDVDLAKRLLEQIISKAKCLVEDYNWNLDDLTILAEQFFGDEI